MSNEKVVLPSAIGKAIDYLKGRYGAEKLSWHGFKDLRELVSRYDVTSNRMARLVTEYFRVQVTGSSDFMQAVFVGWEPEKTKKEQNEDHIQSVRGFLLDLHRKKVSFRDNFPRPQHIDKEKINGDIEQIEKMIETLEKIDLRDERSLSI